MTPRQTHALLTAMDLLRTGRVHAALEALEALLRDNGVRAPGPQEVPQQVPLWMRRS